MPFIHFLSILLIGQLIIFNQKSPVSPIANPEKNLEVQIMFPDKVKGLKSTPCLKVNVLIINHTDTTASFFEDWNSYGYYNISFQIKTSDSTIYTIYKIDKDWPKNFPSFKTLFPRDSMSLEYTLNYNYGNCIGSQFSGTINRTANHQESIKAIYQQRKEALEDARLSGYIKYKKIYKGSGRSRTPYKDDDWVIVDSLKTAVEVNRTFPLTRLESNKYPLN